LPDKGADQAYYNLAVGPVRLRLSAQAGIELNDNVNYSSTDRQADMILRPGLNTAIFGQ